MISIVAFVIVFFSAIFIASREFRRVYLNIKLGKPYENNAPFKVKMRNMLLVAFGQKKMFKRPIPAIFHLFIYVAFLMTQVELLEIIIDGLTHSHRAIGTFLYPNGVGFYNFLINFVEVLSVLALIATCVFLIRRNIIKVPRLNSSDLNGWPKLDANLILFGEIFLVFGILIMNSSEMALNTKMTGHFKFWISSYLSQYFLQFSQSQLLFLMQFGWWMHLFGVLGFMVYLPFSKHLHIFLAFPNTYLTPTQPKGYIPIMPAVFNEIKSMMDPSNASSDPQSEIPTFGARDIQDLSQKNLLDAYTCTECGRCSSSCPANMTGKKLSPRLIMMKTRDRMVEIGKSIQKNNTWTPDGKSLLNDYITMEEVNACTTCNACVEECPVNISPLDIIIQLRRNLIMEESKSPMEWNAMFGNIENNGAPWKFPPSDRDLWSKQQ